VKFNEYENRGEYHRRLSREWSYYPLYISKKKFVTGFLCRFPRDIAILDIGCGEGVFIEELLNTGFKKVAGLDENYSSGTIKKGSVLSLPYQDREFDVVLFLDVIEHISVEKQEDAIKEIYRVLKDEGTLVASIPNLAHMSSRMKFLLKGRLIRTASVEKHPGDRPIKEFLDMFKKERFALQERKGFFPTLPVFYKLIQKRPSRYMWLYRILNLLMPFPGWCFLNILIYKKSTDNNK
jgi:2-polyprenyl-3-methyl-5-hydroxy-6-metoxy-1,4-benzoquinol methylase